MKSASLTLASSATASPQVVDLTGVGTGKKKQTLTPKTTEAAQTSRHPQ